MKWWFRLLEVGRIVVHMSAKVAFRRLLFDRQGYWSRLSIPYEWSKPSGSDFFTLLVPC